MNADAVNAYEAGKQKIIPAVLLYAFYEDRVLMIHRNQKEKDFHEGKWNGLGGKLELGETSLNCAVREFEEESACKTQPEQWTWAGQLSFPNFKPHKNEDWAVTVFRTELTQAQAQSIITQNSEGTLHWVPVNELLALNLWEGDRKFLPLVLKKIPFEGTFFYVGGKLEQFFCNPIVN
jgi:8-oxo-dGTP diphosphatase